MSVSIVALAIAAVVALGAWLAWVWSVMWGWFVVPLGAPALSTLHAFGLLAMYGLLRGPQRPTPEGLEGLKMLGYGLLESVVCLALGYVVRQLMGQP
ncbi:MAG: hypothetical protein U1E23_14920 [Reyranellaceae bacterium]